MICASVFVKQAREIKPVIASIPAWYRMANHLRAA